MKEFKKFATKHRGISSSTLDKFYSVYGNYISPTIIEERQMNIATMDVFSRLMMDRIIFLGVPINDYVANINDASCWYVIDDKCGCEDGEGASSRPAPRWRVLRRNSQWR